ncbi:hypothetical protein AB0H71_12945 [Nocardia sp. NPDC050697]|uniref:hypothetical protein n=1 Tax=Nocardia sp. NPDC050697 TaxID=3155158 RepID=UPI0033E51F93
MFVAVLWESPHDNRGVHTCVHTVRAAVMAASGFYNHYDDPDEFWDDEPLAVVRPVAPSAPPPLEPAPSNPFPKSSLVDVELRNDRLPVAIRLSRAWKDAFAPGRYADSIMDAYRYAVFDTAVRLAESGTVPPATVPPLRDATPLLLRTRTHAEYRELYARLFLPEAHTIHGPGRNEHGEPAIVVTGTRSRLVSISIDPLWSARVPADYIAHDIVECCDRLRASKPEFVYDEYLARESDRELVARLNLHERRLLGEDN